MLTATQKISSDNSQTLTSDNYYDVKSDWPYQSKTWFAKFEQCEAAAVAELKGDWQPDGDVTPLLVGNYLHSYFESSEAHEAFIKENESDIISSKGQTKGQPKAPFKQADRMIKTLEDDANFQALYQGDKEVVVQGNLFGVEWKGKIDCLDLDRQLFLDLKTVDDIHKKHWDNSQYRYVSFAEIRGYDMQMAIYKELIKQTFGAECTPFIIAVSKQSVPDKGVYSIPDYLMDSRMHEIKDRQPRIEAVKNGQVKPKRCEHCDYCRKTKELDVIVGIDEIEFY